MLNKNLKKVIGMMLVMVLGFGLLSACNKDTNTANVTPSSTTVADGGMLVLKVNPEIAISYDNDGKVTELVGVNDDGKEILENVKDYVGKDTKDVMSELITKIGEAGYFVEDAEGHRNKVTIEIEKGSAKPYDSFFSEVIASAKKTVDTNHWYGGFDVVSDKGYGFTDYDDTDYGQNSDGITDYIDTDYGPDNDGVTDYDDTDYGYKNDGVTDYDNDTTDYNDTDYGQNSDGVTDYNNGVTDYENTTNYNDVTNYGTNYQSSDYNHQ